MVICVVILGILLAMLILKYFTLKQQIRKIAKQIKTLSNGESEKILDISLMDEALEGLAGQFNQYYERRKIEVSAAQRHEENLKEMIANITHDLRTPLTVIGGHLQMLNKTSLSIEQQHRVIAAMGKVERMKELTEAFYDLTLLDADQIPIHLERINFTNLLMNFLTENAVLFEHKGIAPVVHIPGSSIFVEADRNMLERILQNLLTNSLRYTSGKIEIGISQDKGNTAILQLSNPAQNISEIDTDWLFERFYTGDRSRTNGSSGLGLAVVKLLAEKMGGSVSAAKNGDELAVTLILKCGAS